MNQQELNHIKRRFATLFKPMSNGLWPKEQSFWGKEDAFASIMQRIRVFVIQGNQNGQEWNDPALVSFFPEYRAQVFSALVPLLTEALHIVCPMYNENQIDVRVVQDSPIELFVAMGPYRATVHERPGLQRSIFLELTRFIRQRPKDMEIGTEFYPEIQSDAGNLHALLSALHTRLLRLEQQSVHYHTQTKLSPGESS